MRSYINKETSVLKGLGEGCLNAMTAISNTSIVTGFGTVVSSTVGFTLICDFLTEDFVLPSLVGVAIATNIIAGACGSASGGLGIVAPLLGPIYTAMGVPAGAVARVMTLSSSALDTLPHNGFVVTVIHGMCHETHKDSYSGVAWLTVFTPMVTNVLAVVLFMLFPNLP